MNFDPFLLVRTAGIAKFERRDSGSLVTVFNFLSGEGVIGLLEGDPEELHKSGAYKDFYMHKIGHWLGLDVHDAGDYMEGSDFMKFKPGMITTIEPGIYISSSMDVDDKWKGIGVRIEDDILVTKDGNENLTKKVPSDPHEIESLMS